MERYGIRYCRFKVGDKVIVGCGSTSDLMNQVSRAVLGVGTIKHIRPAGENNLCMIDFPTSTEYIEVLDTKLLPAGNFDTPSTCFDEISANKFNNQNTTKMTTKKTTKTNTSSKTKAEDTMLSSVEAIEKPKKEPTIEEPKPVSKYHVGQLVMLTPDGVKQCKESFGLSIGNLCKKLTIKNISFVAKTYKYEVAEFPSKQIPENMIVPLSDNPVKAHLQILDLMSEARTK